MELEIPDFGYDLHGHGWFGAVTEAKKLLEDREEPMVAAGYNAVADTPGEAFSTLSETGYLEVMYDEDFPSSAEETRIPVVITPSRYTNELQQLEFADDNLNDYGFETQTHIQDRHVSKKPSVALTLAESPVFNTAEVRLQELDAHITYDNLRHFRAHSDTLDESRLEDILDMALDQYDQNNDYELM